MSDLAILASITADEARRLTDRIKVAVEATWQLVIEAYEGRAWAALGYPSWDDYCTREFGAGAGVNPNASACHNVYYRPLGLTLHPANPAGYIVAPWGEA